MAGTAFAIDQPPQDPQQQRAWLVGHLVTDMEALGTFDGNTLAKVPAIVNALTDDQVALLAQYYYLTRSKTEQDAYLYALQQQGYTDEQVNAAKAQIADLLTDDERPDRGVLRPVRPDAAAGPVRRPNLLRQRAGLVLPCRMLRPRVVLQQRLLRRSLLQRRLLRAPGRCRSATPTTTTAATSTRPTTTSPTPSTSTAARTWRSAKPTGCGTTATGTTRWRTTASCTVLSRNQHPPTRLHQPEPCRQPQPGSPQPSCCCRPRGPNRAHVGNRKPVVHNQAAKPHANRAAAEHPPRSIGRQPSPCEPCLGSACPCVPTGSPCRTPETARTHRTQDLRRTPRLMRKSGGHAKHR